MNLQNVSIKKLNPWNWFKHEEAQESSTFEKNYQITLQVPGMEVENLSIEVQGDSLLVRGEKHESKENKDKEFYRVERSYGTFQRTLALPNDANVDEIKANLIDGVLILTIPRKQVESKKVKRIAIN